jgi:hypothetical protein
MKNHELMEVEKMEQLMRNKSYDELNSEEREWVNQWIDSLEEYELLRKSEIQIRQYLQKERVNPPDQKVLTHLTSRLRLKSAASTEMGWTLKPSWSVLLVACFFGFAGWWIGNSTSANNPVNALQQVVIRDTIYRASKPDTIVIEKVIYRDRPVILTKSVDNDKSNQNPSQPDGINMKEKEELEKLLVSGTE